MSGNVKFDKWVNDDNSENYKCRAWVNFSGQGTVAIRASGNVSSITDNGVGDYTVNLTTAMPDSNYAVSSHVTERYVALTSTVAQFTSASIRLQTYTSGAVSSDSAQVTLAIHR
tara:strand:+ start:226 stop:567 length:342 start_codon:yes stop_codon:yes gene_type:complete